MKLFLFTLLTLFSFPIILAFGDLEDDIDLLLTAGQLYLLNDEFDKAISYFDKVLEIEPNNIDALLNKGRALEKLDKLEEALSYHEKILEFESNNIDALIGKAKVLLRLGKFDEAFSNIDKVFEIDPKNVDVLGYKGDELLRMGKPNEAITYYDRVLEMYPTKVDALGVSYFDKVLEIDPNHISAINAKGASLVRLDRTVTGHTLIFMDKLDKAISYFDKVLEIEPNNIDALFNKGRAEIQLENSEGMSYIDKVLEIQPNYVDALSYKADYLVKYNKLEEGMVYVEKTLANDPKNLEGLFNKGSIMARQHNYSEALTIFAGLLEAHPYNVLVEKNVSITAHKLKQRALDGFMEVTVRDSRGQLVMHLKIPEITVLNHEIGSDFVNGWPVKKIVTRNGQEFEVLQHESVKEVKVGTIYGGADHYGIKLAPSKDVHKVYANYWQYIVQKGDTVNFVYTVYRPIA